MATTKEIKQRIRSVKNTKKITKAMELVSAAKMRKAVTSTLATRFYASQAWDLLQSLKLAAVAHHHPLLQEPEEKTNKTLLILITSNRGLCGAYNSAIIKKAILYINEIKAKDGEVVVIPIGTKGESMMERLGVHIPASFHDLPEDITLRDTTHIAKLVFDEYEEGDYERVVIAYTDYKSALTQTTRLRQVLPISFVDLESTLSEIGGDKDAKDDLVPVVNPNQEYLFEPSHEVIIPKLVQKLVGMQIYHSLLESKASEQSSRMISMKNASDAAGEMIEDLTLVFNKARQASITQEISEISAGTMSMS